MRTPAWWLSIPVLVLLFHGCATGPGPAGGRPAPAAAAAAGAAEHPAVQPLKDRLDFVIRNNVKPADVPRAMGSFSITDYDIQDPGTFWGHRAVAGSGGGSFSEYYLTYRGTYVILLMKDLDESTHVCVDARLFRRTSPDYELTTGRVQVDELPIDEDIIVLVNRRWSGSFSSDIRAAFRANVETGRIEDVPFHSIRIFREE